MTQLTAKECHQLMDVLLSLQIYKESLDDFRDTCRDLTYEQFTGLLDMLYMKLSDMKEEANEQTNNLVHHPSTDSGSVLLWR